MSKEKNTFCPFIQAPCWEDCAFHSGSDFRIHEGPTVSTLYRNFCVLQILPFAIGEVLNELQTFHRKPEDQP